MLIGSYGGTVRESLPMGAGGCSEMYTLNPKP